MTIKSDDTQVNLEQARKFGRVSDDGHVFVIVEGEEYAVGQLPGASEEEALAYFARKFENVEAQVSLLESRVENNSPAADLQKGITSIGAQIGVRNMVGDYASLQERLSALNERIIKLGEAQQQERAENRERALAAREEIVAEAEQIAAQDVFFDARNAAEAQQDEAYAENLKVKEALLVEARALLPVTDISAAKKAFEKILDRWDAAGRVPRADLRRIDSELRKIQDEINGAEAAKWKKNDPAKAARANSLLTQIQDSLAELESELQAAQTSGDAKKIAKAQEALEARRAWAATLEGFNA